MDDYGIGCLLSFYYVTQSLCYNVQLKAVLGVLVLQAYEIKPDVNRCQRDGARSKQLSSFYRVPKLEIDTH